MKKGRKKGELVGTSYKKGPTRTNWVTVQEISRETGLSRERVKSWLQNKDKPCPFGEGFIDENGNFCAIVLRKDFERWLATKGFSEVQ